jgi:hypothetical protein
MILTKAKETHAALRLVKARKAVALNFSGSNPFNAARKSNDEIGNSLA